MARAKNWHARYIRLPNSGLERLEDRVLLTAEPSAGTFTQEQMIQAILALDVYHRGYNTTGILEGSDRLYDYNLSSRTSQDSNLISGVDHQAIGFFAQEYTSDDGETVVAYRGTDDAFDLSPIGTTDVRNGFGIGAGLPHGPQGKAAVDFYNSIIGDGDPYTSPVQVTGQSLGGGLAGYVAALYGKDATIFAHMPYDAAAQNAYDLATVGQFEATLDNELLLFTTLQQYFGGVGILDYSDPFVQTRFLHGLPNQESLDPEGVQEMREDIWGGVEILPPSIDGIESFHVLDEALYFGRLLACKSQEPDALSLDVPPACVRGSSDPIARARVGHYVDSAGEGLGAIHPKVDEKHYQSTFVISAFGYTKEITDDAWQVVFPDIWPALFKEEVAEAAGFWTLEEGDNQQQDYDDTLGLKQPWPANGLLQLELAYSVINDDGRPFGDTGIRALYDDTGELGRVTGRSNTPQNVNDSLPGLAQIVVQFAGQMARQATVFDNHPDLQPEQGVLSFSTDGQPIAQVANVDETAGADLLSINLTKELWNLTDLDEQHDNDFGPPLDPDREVRVEGLDEILINLFDESVSLTDSNSEALAALEQLYGVRDLDPTIYDQVRIGPYLARVDFALENDLPVVRIANGLQTDIPPDQAGLYVAGDGPQTIIGDSQNNILVGAGDQDVLVGGFGKDVLIGRGGNDFLVDLISAPQQDSSALPADSHNDIYIGGENFAYENWIAEFLRRWGVYNDIANWQSQVEAAENESDIVGYSLRSSLEAQDGHQGQAGLIVTDVDLTPLGDVHAPRLTIYDPNTGRTSTDHFMFVDTILLSETGDQLRVGDNSWDVPAFIHMGDFVAGPATKSDWDEVTFENFPAGITMVNGVTRHGDTNGPLPDSFAGKLFVIADALDYFGGFPPGEFSFTQQAGVNNHLLRSAGAERITGTPFDDTLYFNDVEKLRDLFNNWPEAGSRPTIGEIDGGAGHDVIFHQGGEYFAAGDVIPNSSGGAPDFGPDTVAAEEMRMTIQGGTGDDRLMSAGGTGTILIGGDGRDFLFNTSYSGQLYGDTIDGLNQSTSGAEDADVFWFWPGTFIMDAQPNDSLEIFGIPLVGGTNGTLGYLSASGGGLATDWLDWTTYYGQTSSDQLFVYNPLVDLIVNAGDSRPDTLLSKVQVIEDYDFGGFRDDAFGVPEAGDLGMTFRFYVGEDDDALEISLFHDTWGHLISYLDVLMNFAKLLRWQPLDDPLVLDLDGDGIETTSLLQSGVYFDLDQDYFRERTGWLKSDDGFLVLDWNGNATIDDGSELFGGPDVSAYAQLADLDNSTRGGNEDGLLTPADSMFGQLQVWRDFDQDGQSRPTELFSLSDLEIVSLEVSSTPLDQLTPQGHTLRATASYARADGEIGESFEAIFETDPTDTIFRGDRGTADWLKSGLGSFPTVPDAKGFGSMANLAVDLSNDYELAATVASAAASMTTPTLPAIREAAEPVFGAWSQSLERTRELTPTLLQTTATGDIHLVDHATYVEDETGGYWTRSSGLATLDSQGAPLERPQLQDILAQPTEADFAWQLQQAYSPSSRSSPVEHRTCTAYLVTESGGRVRVIDYAEQTRTGAWQLHSLRHPQGDPIQAATLAQLMADVPATAPDGAQWRMEHLGHNPYAELPADRIGVQLVDGQVIDYTVQITDDDGDFHVWARNLDRALELQHAQGNPHGFNLRNYEIDFNTLDEVGSTDDSAFRVEVLTAGQFHFASSIFGIDFQPQVMYATTDSATGQLRYSVGSFNGVPAETVDEQGGYVSSIEPAIEMFDALMQNYVQVSRAFAVRLALQGGLADFAPELVYTADTDEFRAIGDRELAPMFAAIFSGAPAGADASYAYLQAWDEILEVVYPDYHLNENTNFITGTLRRDQAFVLQMLLPGYETVGIDADLPAVLHALGVDETKLIEHTSTESVVDGTRGRDYFYVGEGDQTYRGGDGADIYFVGQNFGNDVIEDVEAPLVGIRAPDQLRFSHVASTDIRASRDGFDLVLQVANSTDQLRVKNQFEGENMDPLLGYDISDDTEMVSIVFADGVIWDRYQIAEAVSAPLETDDAVLGSQSKDILQGGPGSDVLRGGRDGDVYIFRQGDGADRIADGNDRPTDDPRSKSDLLMFGGPFNADDLRFHRAGESDDVSITILDHQGNATSDQVTLEGQFDWINVPFLGLMFPDAMERLAFEDGTYLTADQVMQRVLEQSATDGSDALYGFNRADLMDGGPGDDVLIGRAQNDTYVYATGYGDDLISDRDDDFFADSIDTIRFPDLRWSDFIFRRDGQSATIILEVAETGETLTLEDQFRNFPFTGFTNQIEEFQFADGTTWDWVRLAQHVIDLAATDQDDIIYGFDIDDVLSGGLGNDRLEGGVGADTYIFARGFGNDQVFDSGSAERDDRLVLREITFDDVEITREGTDLRLSIRDTGETITLIDQYVRHDQQGHAIESLEFADRTVRFVNLNPEDVDVIGTNASELLEGSHFGETLDGRGGDDILIGRSDGDVYRFDAGYGHDEIVDRQTRVAWTNRDGLVVKETDDRVQFGEGMTFANTSFAKDADDLLISILGHPDTLRVKNQFASIEDSVEWFSFSGGPTLHASDIDEQLAIVGGSWGDDIITGVLTASNTLDGRQGDDVLRGGHWEDTYAFGAAYDLDEIIESDTPVTGAVDRVVFSAAVHPDEMQWRREGEDLVADLGNGEDQLRIIAGLSTRQVEAYTFADGTAWSLEDIREQLVKGTPWDDELLGFDDRDDLLDGKEGSDRLEGGLGNDEYRFNVGYGQDSIFDLGGDDIVRFGDLISPQMLTVSDEQGDLLIRLQGHTDSLILFDAVAEPSSRVERFIFSDGSTHTIDDILRAIVRDSSTPGDDIIDARLGIPVEVEGGPGNDLILGQADTVLRFGLGDGMDVWDTAGQSGESRIVFADFTAIDAQLRRIDLDGPDVLIAFPTSGDQLLIRNALGTANVSTITFADGESWTRDQFIAAAVRAQSTDRDDVITGSQFADEIRPGRGDDDVEGGFGNDTYYFLRGDGHDLISDQRGFDRLELRGYRPEDVIVSQPIPDRQELQLRFQHTNDAIVLPYDGLQGIDVVAFGDGTEWTRDVMQEWAIGRGTPFQDEILGNDAPNVLAGLGGNDWLSGGRGDDVYLFSRGAGRDIIQDQGHSSDQNTLIIQDYTPADVTVVTYEDRINDLTLRFADGDEIVIIGGGVENGSHIAQIVFHDGTPWSLDDAIATRDTQRVPSRDETLTGTLGPDELLGGPGNDLLSGKDGSDRYIFRAGDGHDVIIEDGQYDQDVLRIEGYAWQDVQLSTATAHPHDLLLRFPASTDSVRVVNTLGDTVFHQIEQFEFVDVGDASIVALTIADIRRQVLQNQATPGDDRVVAFLSEDTLTGGQGDDFLSGGDGSDLYVFRAGDGRDTIDDNGRYDTDVLRFVGYERDEATFSTLPYDPNDLLIQFAGGDQVLVVNALDNSIQDQIERFEFTTESLAPTDALTIGELKTQLASAATNYQQITGDSASNELRGQSGPDVLVGYDGSDTYVVQPGGGYDIIEDNGLFDTDILRIEGYASDAIHFTRQDSHLEITFADSDDRILLVRTLNSSSQDQIEQIHIDGTVWTMSQVRQRLLQEATTPDNDRLLGFVSDDVLSGGLGDDYLSGGDGSDTYQYFAGDGQDVVDDNGVFDTDLLWVRGYDSSQVRTARATYDPDNLILWFPGTTDRIEILNALNNSTQDQIERFQFDDVTWTIDQIKQQLLVDRYTDFDDVLHGTDVAERLVGGLGNDQLFGAAGGDHYEYHRGDGYDLIVDPGSTSDHLDELRLFGIAPQQVQLQAGFDTDLEVVILESSPGQGDAGRITVRNSLLATGTQGLAQIIFDDGTVWKRAAFESIRLQNPPTHGDDRILGTTQADELEGGPGNDFLIGLGGDDVYGFQVGDGWDLIRDSGDGDDVVRIVGYRPDDAQYSRRGRSGQDLSITLGAAGDQLTIINGLVDQAADRVERIFFADTGDFATLEDIKSGLVSGNLSPSADIVVGTAFPDQLTGLGGADLLIGAAEIDTYTYFQGDGDVWIVDDAQSQGDTVLLPDLLPTSLTAVNRQPPHGSDLVLQFAGKSRLTLRDSLGASWNGIETIVFADGTEWSLAEMRSAVLEFAATPHDSQIRGFSGDDLMRGAQGDDLLIGGPGDDTYQFFAGDGQDIVDDQSDSRFDRLELVGLKSTEASVGRLYKGSNSVTVRFANGQDAVTIVNALHATNGVETILFADGVTWTPSSLVQMLENRAPVARRDGILQGQQDTVWTIAAEALLQNDFDADDDAIEIVAVGESPNGGVTLNADGSVTYSPDAGFYGPTTFVYTISDGRHGLAHGEVSLRISPPSLARDDSGLTVAEDGHLVISTERLLANDVEGSRMLIAQVLDAVGGEVSLASNGEISFTPAADYHGPASFRYVANTPAGGRAEAVVSVTVTPVNDAPVTHPDVALQTTEDLSFTIHTSDLLGNDVDVDGDSLSLVSVSAGSQLFVELQPDDTILIQPMPFFFGTATFDYLVTDGQGATSTGEATVTVLPVNNSPTPAADAFTIDEDEPILMPLADLLANDFDVDGDALQIVSVRSARGGQVELFTENQTLLFSPSGDYYGQAFFYYTVADGEGGRAEAPVSLQINPVNDAPVARKDRYDSPTVFFLDGREDEPLTIAISDLLQNDSDVDSVGLTLTTVTESTHGIAEIAEQSIVFTPHLDFWGEASFVYVVKDEDGLVDDATVTLYLAPVGDAPPVAAPDSITVYEDVATTIPAAGILGNDTDVDRDTLQIASVTMPPNLGTVKLNDDGSVLVTPATNLNGFAYFDYVVTDNADGTDSSRVTLNVLPVNDAPTASVDAGSTSLDVPFVVPIDGLLSNDFDVDVAADEWLTHLTFQGVHSPSDGTARIHEDAFLVVEFPTGFSGEATLLYTIVDEQGAADDGLLRITVGTQAVDDLDGTPDRDLLIGSYRAESIRGHAGNDDLQGRAGDDLLNGGDGADRFDGG